MMHPLTVQMPVYVTMTVEQLEREDRVEHLSFLEAQDVRLMLSDEALDQPRASSHRVDVPGCNFQPCSHEARLPSRDIRKRPPLRGLGARAA